MYWKCQRLIISAFRCTALKVWATYHFQTDQNDICSFADDKCGKFDQTVPLKRTLNRSEFVQGKTTKTFQRLNGLSSLTFYQVHRNVFASENHCTTKKFPVFKHAENSKHFSCSLFGNYTLLTFQYPYDPGRQLVRYNVYVARF